MTTPVNYADIGFVIIGRNEGQRLVACLNALKNYLPQAVYVDSGSTDDSVKNAQLAGFHVCALNMSIPFTAARARNSGFNQLIQHYPHLKYVHFLDGDCILAANWVEQALSFMQNNAEIAVVCGRRKEIYPEQSIYNTMCDMEWNTPIGLSKACGGDALFSVSAFQAANGYRDSLIAGEEPELCIRIRQLGFKVWCLDALMTKHDAAIFKFAQWWKRSKRTGYAYAEGAYLHGRPPENHWVKERNRGLIWAIAIPLLCVTAIYYKPIFVLLLCIYPLQIIINAFKLKHLGKFAIIQSVFFMLGKFAETTGQLKYYYNRVLNKNSQLIEYKSY